MNSPLIPQESRLGALVVLDDVIDEILAHLVQIAGYQPGREDEAADHQERVFPHASLQPGDNGQFASTATGHRGCILQGGNAIENFSVAVADAVAGWALGH